LTKATEAVAADESRYDDAVQRFIANRDTRDERSQWLAALDEAGFRVIVEADCKAILDHPAASLLRHPDVLNRWDGMLRVLLEDARAQVEERSGGVDFRIAARENPEFAAWYRKFARWRERITVRRVEAMRLMAERDRATSDARREAREQRRAARKTEKAVTLAWNRANATEMEIANRLGVSAKARKRTAGEAATRRLIELHSDEFHRLLTEEHENGATEDTIRQHAGRLIRAGLAPPVAEAFASECWPAGDIAPGVRLEVDGEHHARTIVLGIPESAAETLRKYMPIEARRRLAELLTKEDSLWTCPRRRPFSRT
jgi:hypothetical protein